MLQQDMVNIIGLFVILVYAKNVVFIWRRYSLNVSIGWSRAFADTCIWFVQVNWLISVSNWTAIMIALSHEVSVFIGCALIKHICVDYFNL